MTEPDWLAGDDWSGMLHLVRGRVRDRKLRLYACGCCRLVWDRLTDQRSHVAVEVAERFADGGATAADLAAAYRPARRVAGEWARRNPAEPFPYYLIAPADAALQSVWDAAHTAAVDAGWASVGWEFHTDRAVRTALAALARDVFGNPFRPVTFHPRWRTTDTVGLARAIYEDRAFDRLPLLADALMDAGCGDDQLLNHCRSGGPHTRGCWAVDLALGKE